MKRKLASVAISAAALAAGTVTTSAAAKEPIDPLHPVQQINLVQVELSKKLYFDPCLVFLRVNQNGLTTARITTATRINTGNSLNQR